MFALPDPLEKNFCGPLTLAATWDVIAAMPALARHRATDALLMLMGDGETTSAGADDLHTARRRDGRHADRALLLGDVAPEEIGGTGLARPEPSRMTSLITDARDVVSSDPLMSHVLSVIADGNIVDAPTDPCVRVPVITYVQSAASGRIVMTRLADALGMDVPSARHAHDLALARMAEAIVPVLADKPARVVTRARTPRPLLTTTQDVLLPALGTLPAVMDAPRIMRLADAPTPTRPIVHTWAPMPTDGDDIWAPVTHVSGTIATHTPGRIINVIPGRAGTELGITTLLSRGDARAWRRRAHGCRAEWAEAARRAHSCPACDGPPVAAGTVLDGRGLHRAIGRVSLPSEQWGDLTVRRGLPRVTVHGDAALTQREMDAARALDSWTATPTRMMRAASTSATLAARVKATRGARGASPATARLATAVGALMTRPAG